MTYPPQPGQWDPSAQPPRPPKTPPGHYLPQGWSPQPPPQEQGSRLKWLLIGVAVLLVVAISVGVTIAVFLARDGSGPGGTTSTAAPSNASDLASANDTGPVSIITSEPTCPAWAGIYSALANIESNGWGSRDQSSLASGWSPQIRAQYEAVGVAMRSAADQAVGLAKQTPHRVMREMYEQFITYGRAYADSLTSYEPSDDFASLVNVYLGESIAGVCNAIERGTILTRSVSVPSEQPPKAQPSVGDVNRAERFVPSSNSSCAEWVKATSTFESSLDDWGRLDPGVPAAARNTEQSSVAEGAQRTFDSYATTMVNLGRQQGGVFEDFAVLGALYLRAYAAATPSYTSPDSWISPPGLRLNNAVSAACRAVTG